MIRRGTDPTRTRKGFTILGFVLASTEVFGALSSSQTVALFFTVFSLAGLGLATANYWALTQTSFLAAPWAALRESRTAHPIWEES